jgi:hypothetical protein
MGYELSEGKLGCTGKAVFTSFRASCLWNSSASHRLPCCNHAFPCLPFPAWLVFSLWTFKRSLKKRRSPPYRFLMWNNRKYYFFSCCCIFFRIKIFSPTQRMRARTRCVCVVPRMHTARVLAVCWIQATTQGMYLYAYAGICSAHTPTWSDSFRYLSYRRSRQIHNIFCIKCARSLKKKSALFYDAKQSNMLLAACCCIFSVLKYISTGGVCATMYRMPAFYFVRLLQITTK